MMLTATQVPRQTAHVSFGPVSQIDIQAHPLNAEARENPAAIAAECQLVADTHGLPVAFACELRSGGWSRHTFHPQAPRANEPIAWPGRAPSTNVNHSNGPLGHCFGTGGVWLVVHQDFSQVKVRRAPQHDDDDLRGWEVVE